MNIRTDLAMEAAQSVENKNALSGVTQERFAHDEFEVTRVCIHTQDAAKALGKKIGTYVTLEHPDLCFCDPNTLRNCGKLLAEEIRAMLPEEALHGCILITGLGNARITPDALGPQTAGKVFVTRHLIESLHIRQIDGVPLRNVCSISPGVLGVTGLETSLVIQGLCEKLKPTCIICIDSLASMNTSRLLSTVQIGSSGIAPGSGVGNHTHALDEDTLGVPVIAIGIPTVVYASTIIHDAGVPNLAVSPQEDLLVTPRNIDEANEVLSSLIADGINRALQPDLPLDQMI